MGQSDVSGLRVLQLNINGLTGKIDQILNFMRSEKIAVAVLQETKLTPKSKALKTPGFTFVRCDRPQDKGGGLAFLVDENIPFEEIRPPASFANDAHLESQSISIKLNNSGLLLLNVYIPPQSSCARGYKASIAAGLPTGDALVLGDFNAHDELWGSAGTANSRGADIAEEIGSSNFGVLNEEAPTRLPASGSPSSPDISLASLSLLATAEWATKTALSSDHVPIVISLKMTEPLVPAPKRTFTNLAKADWDGFLRESEALFASRDAPNDVQTGEKIFRETLCKAAKHNIPSGRIPMVRPTYPQAAIALETERDRIRTEDPHSPLIAELNARIASAVKEHRRNKWHEKVESLDRMTGVSKLWKTIKSLYKGGDSSPNQAISFGDRSVTETSKIASCFNRLFTAPVRHRSSPATRKLRRKIRRRTLADAPSFSPEEVSVAIKRAKASKAFGPDGLTMLHLRHLGPRGSAYLAALFNLSLSSCKIPAIWKTSTIVPLLKPGKDAAQAKSYRPVSLLCPAIKVLERLLLPALNEHLPDKPFQHGFRPEHSTTSALLDINAQIADGFNQRKPPRRTVLLQIDLSKAFDMVNHDKLMADLNNSTLPGALVRWFNCYLHGRQARVNFRGCNSRARNVRVGVPQGAVTSPKLFNFFISGMPTPPGDMLLVTYADDVSTLASDPHYAVAVDKLNDFTPRLTDFFDERGLPVSLEKSTVTLITPQSAQATVWPQAKMYGKTVPLERHPKILGVTYDTMYTFSRHCQLTKTRVAQRNNVLKALAGTSWGQDKETLMMTYKAIGRSVLNYAAPIWAPVISDTSWAALQVAQNQALRTATGCHSISSIDHLHQETSVLPVRRHSELLSDQYWLACHKPTHPGFKHTQTDAPPRRMKGTLASFSGQRVAPLINGASITPAEYKQALTQAHTETVQRSIHQQGPNRVLGVVPPSVHEEERTLPRGARTALAQLRSGFCSRLNSYQHRITKGKVPDKCGECGGTPHDVPHLFSCTSTNNPAGLTVADLWARPVAAAGFLHL